MTLRAIFMTALAGLSLTALAAWLIFGSPPAPGSPNPAGPAIHVVGSRGLAPGQFQQPRGITGLADGSFVVVDRAARVQHMTADGKFISVFCMKDHDLGNPKGLCALPDGNLLVCDTHYGRVLVMTVTGEVVKIWGQSGRGPAQFTHPLSAVVDLKREAAYIVEYGDRNDRVQKFKLDGTFLKMWGTFGSSDGEFQRPSGVALDAAGNVYVADAVNHRIQAFDGDGKFLRAFGTMGRDPGQLRYPYDIACGPDGLLYVAEFNNHRISVFDTQGKYIRFFGGPGSAIGEFASPWSLTVDRLGRLLVSDTANYRVQIIDINRVQNRNGEVQNSKSNVQNQKNGAVPASGEGQTHAQILSPHDQTSQAATQRTLDFGPWTLDSVS